MHIYQEIARKRNLLDCNGGAAKAMVNLLTDVGYNSKGRDNLL